mmetsp:Transcript_91343/g.257950  ORF Transcript_91343/g.257950 Transcript_91343/m.257950 type:complete len:304 (+) Transcript_91343:507-1418(+)
MALGSTFGSALASAAAPAPVSGSHAAALESGTDRAEASVASSGRGGDAGCGGTGPGVGSPSAPLEEPASADEPVAALAAVTPASDEAATRAPVAAPFPTGSVVAGSAGGVAAATAHNGAAAPFEAEAFSRSSGTPGEPSCFDSVRSGATATLLTAAFSPSLSSESGIIRLNFLSRPRPPATASVPRGAGAGAGAGATASAACAAAEAVAAGGAAQSTDSAAPSTPEVLRDEAFAPLTAPPLFEPAGAAKLCPLFVWTPSAAAFAASLAAGPAPWPVRGFSLSRTFGVGSGVERQRSLCRSANF